MSVKKFKKDGYFLIKNALKAELRDVITQYALFDEMQNFTPDGVQVPNAHSKYADPAMEALLLHLHPIIEKNTELNLYPTYSYYRVYRNGDELTPHTDRPSCEISATVCFNYSYGDDYDWPIFMNNKKISMNPGDLVVYRGIDIPHWREKLNPPDYSWHVQVFFHYVDSSGSYSGYKFDKRESVGSLGNVAVRDKRYIKYV